MSIHAHLKFLSFSPQLCLLVSKTTLEIPPASHVPSLMVAGTAIAGKKLISFKRSIRWICFILRLNDSIRMSQTESLKGFWFLSHVSKGSDVSSVAMRSTVRTTKFGNSWRRSLTIDGCNFVLFLDR